MTKLQQLSEERIRLVNEARAINTKAETEKRGMTEAEDQEFNRLMNLSDEKKKEMDKIVAEESRRLRLDAAAAEMESTGEAEVGGRQAETEERTGNIVLQFPKRAPWAQRTVEIDAEEFGVTATKAYRRGWKWAQRALASEKDDGVYARRCMAKAEKEFRSMQMDINTAGGFLVPPLQFIADLIQAVDDQVFIRQLATTMTLTNAVSLGAPSRDSDADDSDWTSELAVGGESAGPTVGRRDLTPHPLAKYIKISNKLLRASAIDPESLIRTRLSYKFGITQEKAFMTGDGVQKPLGLFTASANGISTNADKSTGSATGFVADNLIDAKYALKPQYWPRARWLFHRNAIASIRKLKDSQNQYLWNPGSFGGQGLIAGTSDRLLDLPMTISEYCPGTLTTGLYVGMLGDFSNYWIVDALSLTLQRLTELFALTNQTAIIGRLETDAMPVLEEAFVRLKTA